MKRTIVVGIKIIYEILPKEFSEFCFHSYIIDNFISIRSRELHNLGID